MTLGDPRAALCVRRPRGGGQFDDSRAAQSVVDGGRRAAASSRQRQVRGDEPTTRRASRLRPARVQRFLAWTGRATAEGGDAGASRQRLG